MSHRRYEYLEATQIPKEDGHNSNQLTHFSWLQALSPELKFFVFQLSVFRFPKNTGYLVLFQLYPFSYLRGANAVFSITVNPQDKRIRRPLVLEKA